MDANTQLGDDDGLDESIKEELDEAGRVTEAG